MKIIKNIFKFEKNNSSKGYTLLFAVIVSVLVLSIGTFILSVSRKQAILASSARDSVYAFYSADSGLECALEHLDILATSTAAAPFNCGAVSSITVGFSSDGNIVGGNNFAAGTSTFLMPTGSYTGLSQATQSGVSSCASTTVSYFYQPGILTGNSTSTDIVVTSRGYNIGWSGHDCSATGPRKVERALQYTASQ
jgi:Tfp pilus assembly protein PilX